MLFNSHFFIFAFLPASLFVYFALGRLSRDWALRWIIITSLIFYAWWRPGNVFIIVPAMLVNFTVAKLILYYVREEKATVTKLLLTSGIVFNLVVLGYFKYTNFLLAASNDVFGSGFVFKEIVLPLGISFITFQMIAFLVDVHGRKIESFRFQDFFSFVLFFPQLIAGPIVHYREMMPQFHNVSCRFSQTDLSVGITLFFFGLFKKVVIADSLAPLVSSIYAMADSGQTISLIPAWLSAIGFTFQIYFDFSGYSDMALGAARIFGIRLPVNFNSPLRSSNIIDFWLRWHVSLTRFLTAYIYNPIALRVTRRRMAAGKSGFSRNGASLGAFLQLLMLPAIVTMLLSGLWHGAGYLFIGWGLMHGVYLTVNHAWRLYAHPKWSNSAQYERVMKPLGFALTFVCVAASMVVFRSLSLDTAANILSGMAGMNGIATAGPLYDSVSIVLRDLALLVLLVGPIALFLPNTLQILDRYEPAIGFRESDAGNLLNYKVSWRPSLIWALVVTIVAVTATMNIGGYTEFLYWQF